MIQFVESLKRLYLAGNVSLDKLEELKKSGKLTEEELAYIKE